MGQVDDVRQCVTMDLKEVGNALFQVGVTRDEMGGSHFGLVRQLSGGRVPEVQADQAKSTFRAVHEAIQAGQVRACHDMSEGGMAVALAEMAFAGGLGMDVSVDSIPGDLADATAEQSEVALLFSESNTRFICEVPQPLAEAFEQCLQRHDVPCARIGTVTPDGRVKITGGGRPLIDADIATLKDAWQSPLKWS